MNLKSTALIDSLKNAPLLAHDLLNAPIFDRSLFGDTTTGIALNFDQKLGHLYEQALENLIHTSPSLSLLASHVQIFDDTKRTIGEMDFILFDHVHNQHIHLELAVKFYLALDAPNGWHFPGPNAHDNWHRKLNHMQKKQLTISQTPEAKTLLRDSFQIETISIRQLIYGCLFTPIDCEQPPEPRAMSEQRQQGRWLYARQWQKYFNTIENVLFIPKPLWPLEISPNTVELFETMSIENLIKNALTNCTMIVLKETSEKIFLVPDTWGQKSMPIEN